MSFVRRIVAVSFVLQAFLPVGVFAQMTNDPLVSDQWFLSKIQASKAWGVTTGSSNVIVAVIDTGVDIMHEDLKENVWTNPGEIPENGIDDDGDGLIDDVHGWNFIDQTNDVSPHRVTKSTEESIAHGTIVSSLIGAKGGNGRGMAGVAWNVRIMPIVALDAEGQGPTDDVALAIRYAVDRGAQIVNLSMEGPLMEDALGDAIGYAADHRVLVVTVSGNAELESGNDLSIRPVYPACVDVHRSSLMTVSGTDKHDQKSLYANYGSCVDIAAPSVDMLAAEPVLTDDEIFVSGYSQGWSGTSLAAPLVSGAAALLKSMHPDWSPLRMKKQLMQTADPIMVAEEAYRGKMGSGRLNVGSALTVELLPESFDVLAAQRGSTTVVSLVSSSTQVIYPFGKEDVRGAHAAIGDKENDGEPEIAVVPASGTSADFVLYASDGNELARLALPGLLVDGATVASVAGGYVVADANGGAAWGIDADLVIRRFYPYEAHYTNGLDLLTVQHAAAFAPRQGGGRLVISDVRGKQLVSAFPFGTEPDGRWSLARMDASDGSFIVFSGPMGNKRVSVEAMGQLGWTPVSFDDLSVSRITLSSGMRTQDPMIQSYGTWSSTQ
ncbi:MAG: S8 family serine peptidase [Candidatus Uhrbacteria bacterium]|nr:S8 family serine peptidase [Candidatus Uhrbacteria bacterium]